MDLDEIERQIETVMDELYEIHLDNCALVDDMNCLSDYYINSNNEYELIRKKNDAKLQELGQELGNLRILQLCKS